MLEFLFGLSWVYWLAFIPVLGFLIFIHELGHFMAARWMGVKVEEFGFGIPPRAATLFERNGVKYTLNWLPIGGFVRMVGEEGSFDAPGSLYSKQPWQRAIVLVAGAFFNLVTAAVLFAIVFATGFNVPVPMGHVQVYDVSPDSPAQAAGMQKGDLILTVAGTTIERESDLLAAIDRIAGQTVPVVVERQGQPVTLTLTPRAQGRAKAGIYIGPERYEQTVQRYGLVESIGMGVRETVAGSLGLLAFLGQAITGLFTREPLPEGGLTGPVGIARMAGEVAREGMDKLLYFAAAISVSLGTLNLLPFPALDGGRLIFVAAEWLRGKRIPPEREAVIHALGMMTLLLLMLVVGYFDVAKWVQGVSPLGGG